MENVGEEQEKKTELNSNKNTELGSKNEGDHSGSRQERGSNEQDDVKKWGKKNAVEVC